MCGITGFWRERCGDGESVLDIMAARIRSRGPDDSGVYFDNINGLGLAHRRLAVMDLSPAGHQPMHSPCGRYVLVFNGEIYNHLRLRDELTAVGGNFDWRGHSDTETLLAALRYWGVKQALQRLNGMFAFALWDSYERKLYLARDRMGEKPLYYGRSNNCFLFGSELKAISAHPSWQGVVDRNVLALYLRFSYVPGPWSIYEGIAKLPPAHYVEISEGGRLVGVPVCYWNLGEIARAGAQGAGGESSELLEEFDALMRDAIAMRLQADVPLGAFLSGGYDSTAVVALMQEINKEPIRTFTIGFEDADYNEAHHAKAIAHHLGTQHTELYVTPDNLLGAIPNLQGIWDEPFADSSQLPTYLVCQLARQHVTVALSGDAGDELLLGYKHYQRAGKAWHRLSRIPLKLRAMLGGACDHVPNNLAQRLVNALGGKTDVGLWLAKCARAMSVERREAYFKQTLSHWFPDDNVVLNAREAASLFDLPEHWPHLEDFRNSMMYLDMMQYLPDDILVKVDRASMAVSLEARVPLLDHRLVEFAWRVPLTCKQRGQETKWLLRELVHRRVPRELMERPKMGFGVPVDAWLRGPLRDWAESLLDATRLRQEGYLATDPIRQRWQEHLSGQRAWGHHLWDVLMFQSWLEHV